jgi:hypothetical protein
VDRVGELVERASALMGKSLALVADRSWPHGVSTVIEVDAADGTALLVKSPADFAKIDAELHAYRSWAPALGSHVPELPADDRDHRILVLSKLPGEIGDLSVTTFAAAGRLLRRLHDAQPPEPIVNFATQFRDRNETWIRRARDGLLPDDEIDFVRTQVALLDGLADPAGVPCHRDWQPRNWLTAPDGTVAIIDFGNLRLDETARSQLRATSIHWLLSTVVWADEVDDVAFGEHARRQLHDAMTGVTDPI